MDGPRDAGLKSMLPRVGPEIFDCCGAGSQVVETRRLELLTLSLQRRRSAN